MEQEFENIKKSIAELQQLGLSVQDIKKKLEEIFK